MADMMKTDAAPPPVIRREDYRPPAWLVPDIALDFDLGLSETRVKAALDVTRNGNHDEPLRLDGDEIDPVSVSVDGMAVNDWHMDGPTLVLPLSGDIHRVEIETRLTPDRNTKLMGLYASNGMICTQCEAEGFRRITFFPDRPDVLSRYVVRMAGDATAFPVLLSNGDRIATGKGENGRHWAEWRDPFPKPSYLFALVAGDLVCNADSFTTMSGRRVELGIWVRDGDLDRTHHAMDSLKASMKWDEDVYGREYDLDIFNIVAVADFNMGAMENKGLNIFNTRYILADPDTATDADYDGVEGVVAHEYFHNWSGNRVTCRDWFQLSLKEGFTVLRDQQFSAAMGSEALKRIEDVRVLRAAQFPEDAGPLAHPIRPDSYMEISNFYTATIYNKGAEVIRMMLTMIGAERFRAGTDLYFDRNDGSAATCEDFVAAIETGGGIDLKQFRHWYSRAGTPRVKVTRSHDAASGEVTLTLSQTLGTAHQPATPSDMVIPLKAALIDRATGQHGGEQLLLLDTPEKTFSFPGFTAEPALSINRAFSAPVIVETGRDAAELAFLSGHDDDSFARFEAMQQLMTDHLVAAIGGKADPSGANTIVDAVARTLDDSSLDPALVAEIVLLPTESFLGEQMLVVDPQAIHQAREELRQRIARELADRFEAIHARAVAIPYSRDPEARAARRIAGVALAYLQVADPAANAARAFAQFRDADNMTTRLSALQALAQGDSEERVAALDIFYNRWRDDALVLDKWFGLQALSLRADTLDQVRALADHPDFTLSNPNRIRALYGSFSANQVRFHDVSGDGYRMLADLIITLDQSNPQTAARFVPALGRWRRLEAGRAAQMRAELERINASGPRSRDVTEQVVKSLG